VDRDTEYADFDGAEMTEDLTTLRARYAEYKASYDNGEISLTMWSGVRSRLEEQIATAGGTPPLDERLRAIDVSLRKKTEHISRMYAVTWLREPEQIGWLAEQFDAAEGTTVERLEAALVALRARLGETPE